MQVGTRQSYALQTDRMASLQSLIEKLQAQVSSGKRINDASDDPVGAARVAQLQRSLDDNSQFIRNIDAATARLSLADTAVEGMSTNLIRARELALVAANGTTTASDRANIASELDQIIDGMLGLANTRDANGDHIFSGARAGSPAFAYDGDGIVRWQGAGRAAEVPIGPDDSVAATVSGVDVLTAEVGNGRKGVFEMLAGFRTLLDRPDPRTDADKADYAALLDGLDSAVGQVNDMRAVLGGRLDRIDAERERLQSVATVIEEGKSSLESADLTKAITDLQGALLILKASQQSFAQIKSLSLFDAIR